jgi:hypothetical protein
VKLTQPAGSRADILEQELNLGTIRAVVGSQDAEGPGQERTLALSPAPALA